MTDLLTYLSRLFAFDSEHPLLFTQFHFWAFFFIVYVGFCLVVSLGGKKGRRNPVGKAQRLWRNGYLAFVSLFFYYKTSGLYVGLLLFATFAGFLLGRWMEALQRRQLSKGVSTQKRRATLMAAGVIVNLAVLCYFKYAYFFTDIFNTIASTHYSIANAIILPVGISFFTFQAISYIMDCYWETVPAQKNFWKFLLYLSLFPQLVAGPIERATRIAFSGSCSRVGA